MITIASAKICLYNTEEGGIRNSIKGRALCPAFYINDKGNSWSTFILFDEESFPGTCLVTNIALLVSDKATELFTINNEFEFVLAKQIEGMGKIVGVMDVSVEEMIKIFHFDIWPGTEKICQRKLE